ncbi:MAG: hypothetical protein QW272_09690 [Candidatus Methanomethylicaceae archaeon]
MNGELILFRGETDGTSTTGTVPLSSDIIYGTVNNVRIPKGLKAKVWFKKISGEGETLFTLRYTHDVTVASPTWIDIEQEKLSSKGEIFFDMRRPAILHSFNGTEAFQIVWTQPTAVKAYLEINVEIGD